MTRRWVIGGLLLAIGACTSPADPLTAPATTEAQPAATGEATMPIAVTVADGLSEEDRQALTSLFESDDVQQYWGNDIVSDGSGAYFTAQALPGVLPPVPFIESAAGKPQASQRPARRPPPPLQRFRKRELRPVARSLRIAPVPEAADQAVLEAVTRMQGAMDLETPLGSRSADLQIKQSRIFHARKQNGHWRLARVGRMTIEPDAEGSTLTLQRLTVTAGERELIDLQADGSPLDIDHLPRVRPGQVLSVTVTAGRSDGTPLEGVTAVLRAPGLASAARLQPETTTGTFSRTVQVPDRPGMFNIGAELIDISGLFDDPARIDMAVWGFTLRVGR